MDSFKEKVIVITGGATGIGFAFAKRFGQEGAKIVIASRRQEKIDEAVSNLKDNGVKAVGTVCDTSDYEQVEKLANFSWEKFGKVDVILNNAGISLRPRPLLRTKIEDFKKVMDINVYGVLNAVHIFGNRFLRQKTPAAIYNVGSENSFFNAVPFNTAYVTSKQAVFAITEVIRQELPDFIDISLICPGLTATDMTASIAAGMNVDNFVDIAIKQLKANEFYIVSHAHNMEYIEKRNLEIKKAYAKYAPRYEGDDEFDIRSILQKTHIKRT